MKLVTTYDIGALIRERRRALSMSQTALAEKLGASRRWVSDIEAGKETAELGRVIKVLRILDICLTAKPVHTAPVRDQSDFLDKIIAHRNKVGLPSLPLFIA